MYLFREVVCELFTLDLFCVSYRLSRAKQIGEKSGSSSSPAILISISASPAFG